MKKIISALLVIAICASMMVFPASAAPSINIKRSYKNGYTMVTLTCYGYVLRYTLDGSAPNTSSKKYTSPIKIKKPSTIRIAAFSKNNRAAAKKADIDVCVKAPKAKLISKNSKKAIYQVTVPDGVTVYITDDGSKPTKTNNVISARGTFKMTVRKNGVYRMRAYKDGWKSSKVVRVKVSSLSKGTVTADVTAPQDDFAAEVLRLVNIEREKEGLPALKTKDKLTEAAQTRAEELPEKFSHTRPDGRSCFTALSDVGLSRGAAGENIAAGQRTPKDVVEGWMNSSGHRANILSTKYHYLGVGFYKGGSYGYYWTQLFTS